LDRDGVLNRAVIRNGRPYPPGDVDAFEILPGVPEACRALKAAGYRLLVVTNQPDVARGTATRASDEAMNDCLRRETAVDAVYVCWHDDADDCACRKPRPGLILEAAEAWRVDPAASFMVGDRAKDIEAGRRAGCRTIWIESGHGEPEDAKADHRARSLQEAAAIILGYDQKTG
jgi:D-glycero-D-manno-heptose 1,7-bisphosphate phosphatase